LNNEQTIGIFVTEIRTIWDRYSYFAFITNYRTILADLKVSSAYLGLGPIGLVAMMKKLRTQINKMKEEGKYSLDNILKSHKNNIEIIHDKINKIDYKYGKKWEAPVLTIYYAEPLRKSKKEINLAILHDQEYVKAKKEEGIKGGYVHIEFGNDVLKIIQPYLGDKLILMKR
jgi:hypothetical protein